MENSAIFPVTRKVTININTAGISFVFRHDRAQGSHHLSAHLVCGQELECPRWVGDHVTLGARVQTCRGVAEPIIVF